MRKRLQFDGLQEKVPITPLFLCGVNTREQLKLDDMQSLPTGWADANTSLEDCTVKRLHI